MSRRSVLLLAALTGLVGVRPAIAQKSATVAPSAKSSSRGRGSKAIDRANLDTTCAACTDFYTFANGGWLTHTTICGLTA